jgi:2-dehydropantoate 2-reductase
LSRPIVVFGAGALGCLLAALSSRRAPTRLVGRAAVVEAIGRQGGVRVEGIASGLYPVEAGEAVVLPPAAAIYVAVKAYDLEAALLRLAPHLVATHLVVVLQNGLGIRTLAERVLARPVLRAVTFLAAAALEPGHVAFNAVGKTYFPPGREVLEAWRVSDAPAVQVPDLLTYVWRKLAINAVINPLSALLGVENGALLPLRHTSRALVEEVVRVANREGIRMEGAETLAKVRSSMRQTARNTSSMLQDVRAGRQTEIDWINGAIVRLADRRRIPVPHNRSLVEMLHLVTAAGSGSEGGPLLSASSAWRR